MAFLGVYTAIYDYAPTGDNELEIKEGDLLFVLEKSSDDDWWKVKKRAVGEEEEEPTGLVPCNYVEEAQPTHAARAIYDYTRQTDEELSFKEDTELYVYDTTDPDWTLVGVDGEFGFAPSNYIDIQEEASVQTPAAVPSLPKRPTQPEPELEPEPEEAYQSPASPRSPVNNPAHNVAAMMNQRLANGPVAREESWESANASDEEEPPTPTLPARPVSVEMPQRSPSGPLASPPYNRVSRQNTVKHDDSPSPHVPGGFRMYTVNEMVTVMGKKKKMPTTLGINNATGEILIAPEQSRDGSEQKWTAEKMTHYSIEGKHVFLELIRPSKSIDFHAGSKETGEEIVSALGEMAGMVRAEGLREVLLAGSGHQQKKGQVLYDFMAQGDDEVTVAVGDDVVVLDDMSSDEWWQVRRLKNGKEGVVPSSYIEITGTIPNPSNGVPPKPALSPAEQARQDEERMAKDAVKVARRDDLERGSEVGPGLRLPERHSSLFIPNNNNNDQHPRKRDSVRHDSSQSKSSKSKPDMSKIRTWTDRSKSFSVEAQFLALKDGKISLHKMNGVKIAVPVSKMSVEDLEYVERVTGESLEEDKPLSDLKRRRQTEDKSRKEQNAPPAGLSVEKKPEYDWFQFFLSCEVAVGLCERYAQVFTKESMDESVLSDVDASVLRTLGIREGDIIKIVRYIDKKFNRNGKKAGAQADDADGSLFSGPGGTLKNNTRKGRPAPAVETNNVIDPNAFNPKEASPRPVDGVATPIASAPVPEKKDVQRSGFDDDAWDVKPSKSTPAPQPAAAPTPAPASEPVAAPRPQPPTLTGSMQELSLLSTPLEPTKAPQPAPPPAPPLPQNQVQPPQPPPVTPNIFAGIGAQQTGIPQLPLQMQGVMSQLPPQQTGFSQQPTGVNFQNGPQQYANIARSRPAPPTQFNQNQGGLAIPAPPNRPLSAPQTAQPSGFPAPPLQIQNTGIQNSSGFQSNIAPPGQSLNDMNILRLQQQQQQLQQQQQQLQQQQTMNMQPTGFQPFNNGMQPQNSFQQMPMQTGMPQQQFMTGPQGASPFGGQTFSPPLQPQATGFQSAFPQNPQQTGVNSFLPPALQPTPTGFGQTFSPPPIPPMPPMPQQNTTPLLPQKTGPAPPVRFGVQPDSKKILAQPTGRRANLSQATPQNPFGF